MKKGFLLITALLALQLTSYSQEISLKECWTWAKEYYPKAKDRQVLLENSTLRIDNLKSAWYPKLNLIGQATWQNEVTSLSNPMIKSTPPNQDQYKVTLDLNQTIYDGGITAAKRKLEEANSETEMINLDVELYNIQKNISDIFFLNQVLVAQKEQIILSKENLATRAKELEASVKAGAVLKSELSVLKVEVLKLEQKLYDVSEANASSIKTLALLTGKPLNPDSTKLLAQVIATMTSENKRIEFQLFDQQKKSLELQSKLASTNRMFQLNAFAQGGYGNPGYNMLKVEWAPIVMVGVKLQWNIWDWGQTSRQKQIMQKSATLIDNQKSFFEQNQSLSRERTESQIRKLERSLLLDGEIIALRQEVTLTSKAKLANGTLRASDYINDLNQESSAVLEQKIREIQLDQARIELMQILGQN